MSRPPSPRSVAAGPLRTPPVAPSCPMTCRSAWPTWRGGLQRPGDAAPLMEVIVSTAVAMVPGAEEASISLTQGRRRVVSAVATGELPRRFDDSQEETRQGPCMDAMYEHETIRVDDLPSERRWPELARRIPELGVASTMCFQLFVAGDDLGMLNLLARRPGAFIDESE